MIVYNTRNNIKVVVSTVNIQEIVSVGMFFRVGSKNEDVDNNGITHVLEHIISEEFVKSCTDVGGRANALTTKEYCCFFSKSLKSQLREVLRSFRIIGNIKFGESNIIKAKETVVSEMQGIDIEQYNDQWIYEEHLQGDSLRFWPIGSRLNIEKLTKEQLIEHYQKYIIPENCVISIVGSIDEEKTIRYIEEIFEDWCTIKHENIGCRNFLSYENQVTRARYSMINTEASNVRILFDGVARNSNNKNSFDLLCNYIGNGVNSKLFQ